MARIRTIKPEFHLNEELFDLESQTGLPIRVAYTGLWCQSDREGRFKWKPRQLKSQVLPYDELDFERVLDALTSRGFVVKYASGTEIYGFIPTFKEHQFINNKERPSCLPNPNDCKTLTCELRDKDALTSRGVKEGKGKDRDIRVEDACNTSCDSDESHGSDINSRRENQPPQRSPLRAWFEDEMWPAVPSAKKRGKEPTWREIEKLKPDEEMRKAIVAYLSAYPTIQRSYDGVKNAFFPEMKDPQRVIRDRRFEDVLVPCDKSGEEAWRYE